MKLLHILFAATAICAAGTAKAETIIESGNSITACDYCLHGFDYDLGTLGRATLTVSISESLEAIGHVGPWPDGAPESVQLDWAINTHSIFAGQLVPISGSGTETITADNRWFMLRAFGESTFDIPLSEIPQRETVPTRFLGDVSGGLYHRRNYSISTDYPLDFNVPGFYCGAPLGGSHNCIRTSFQIAYHYTPFTGGVNNGPVPEPTTWVMMLIGFAGVGYSMRRARKAKAVLQTA